MTSIARTLSWILLLLALTVIVFGSYVRLTDAGLGCPDWPGCYGRLTVPDSGPGVHLEDPDWQSRPLETGKAWREMIHRYLASTLGLGILMLAVIAWRQRLIEGASAAVYALVPLVIFQGLLGMWTVTLLLKPVVVLAHLLGGLATLSLLWWNLMNIELRRGTDGVPPMLRSAARFGTLIVVMQIMLGGWTSANYAALACTDFPTCHGRWWPETDFREAFVMWRGLGINYEFGVLDTPARTAIHLAHRIGAVVTAIFVFTLAVLTLRSAARRLHTIGWCIIAALTVQLGLGITNVLGGLPLAVAVAHNAVAAILLMTLISLIYATPRN